MLPRLPSRLASTTTLRLSLIALACALAMLPARLYEIQRFDEGFIVTGAMLVRDGMLPLRDFYSAYGPAQYVLIASLYGLFGENLLISRLADAALLGITGALIFVCVQRLSDTRSALLATLSFIALTVHAQPNANYPALSTIPLFLVTALLFGKWVQTPRLRTLGAMSICVGLIVLLRWDFGLAGLVVLSVAIGLNTLRGQPPKATFALCAAVLVPGLLISAAVYVPLLAGHTAQWFEEVPKFYALEFANWRNKPFVRPTLWALAHKIERRDIFAIVGNVLELLVAALPFVVLPVAAWCTARRTLRGRVGADAKTAMALLLSLFGLCLLNQMRVRPGLPQAFPAIVIALVLTPWVIGLASWGRSWLRLAAGALLMLLYAFALSQHVVWWSQMAVSRVTLPRATGVLLRPTADWRAYADLVDHVRATTFSSEAIFSGVTDTTRLVTNDALLYFLTARRPATRFVGLEPGIANTERAQREIVGELIRARVRTVVLAEVVPETSNRTSVSNGVTILDDYIRSQFVQTRKFGVYRVLVRRDAAVAFLPPPQ